MVHWSTKLYKVTKLYKSANVLRSYQLEGLNWILRCFYQKRSCILADEMGLGKTVQVVTTLEHLFTREQHAELSPYQTPELLRTPLEELCLQIKSLRLGRIEAFLAKAPEPPSHKTVRNAIELLETIGAMTLDGSEELTPLVREASARAQAARALAGSG